MAGDASRLDDARDVAVPGDAGDRIVGVDTRQRRAEHEGGADETRARDRLHRYWLPRVGGGGSTVPGAMPSIE